MKNFAIQRPRRVLLFALVIAIGVLALPSFGYSSDPHAQSNNQGMSASVYYKEPTTQMGKMKLESKSKIDIITNNIHVSGLDSWRGAHPLYLFAIHYTDFNNDDTERRFVLVVRNSLGNPWFVADMPVKDPDGTSDINRTIWFAFDVDKTILQSNPKIRTSWFAETATSSIELGITDQKEITIPEPGTLSVNERTSLALFKIKDILVFP